MGHAQRGPHDFVNNNDTITMSCELHVAFTSTSCI
jgi:hypothetical protein